MTRGTRRALTAMTAGLWLACIFAATPWAGFIDEDALHIMLCMAVCCTMSITARRANRPADEVYEAGKAVGRAEALTEIESPNVVPLVQPTRLRAVQRLR